MAIGSIRLPHVPGMDFGVGVDRLSGTPMNQVVGANPSPPLMAGGSTQSFEVSRVHSTRDLQESLGIDIEASYGCASFGAGASARFSYVKESEVHTSSLFMTVTATVHHADLSIDNPVLTEPAGQVVDRVEVFTGRYGDMFCRTQKRGGLFVGLMRIETRSSTDATSIEADLQGSYGLFSAEAKFRFRNTMEKYDASCYCSVYAEGGPSIRIDDPTDPTQLLDGANRWKDQMYADPDRYSVPYMWTLAATTIAEGPEPLNAAQIQQCQDILQFCARERTKLLDQLNLLDFVRRHPDRYDWAGAASVAEFVTQARNTQIDLDLVASCASWTINNAAEAKFPADYARKRDTEYPTSSLPTPMPAEKPSVHDLPATARWDTSTVAEANSAALTGGVAVASRMPNALELWWTSPNLLGLQSAYTYDGQPWQRYELKPVYESNTPSRQSGITALSQRPTRLEVWWVGSGGQLQGNWWDEERQGPWMSYMSLVDPNHLATTQAGIAAVTRDGEYLYEDGHGIRRSTPLYDLFWIGADGSVRDVVNFGDRFEHRELAPAGSASPTGAIAAVGRTPTAATVVWLGPDGAVRGLANSGQDGWTAAEVAPAGAASPQGCVAVLLTSRGPTATWLGPDGAVHVAELDGSGQWTRHQVAPTGSAAGQGSITIAPSVTGEARVFWIGPNGSVRAADHTGDRWVLSEVAANGAASPTGAVTAIAPVSGSVELFWIGGDGSVRRARSA